MKCIHCKQEIEKDDNFCPKCGHWTILGYEFLKDENNLKMVMQGEEIKQNKKLSIMILMLMLTVILFFILIFITDNDIYKPFSYLKNKFANYIYGYNTSIIKTDNKYNEEINSYEESIKIIKEDFNNQTWLCNKNIDIYQIERKIEKNYDIPVVSFCDMPYFMVKKIEDTINKMYELFPNIKGSLTNITITNAHLKDYIAYFQPMYQFVNIDKSTNKVNKTQILLNSYYFLNEDILKKDIKEIVGDYYPKDATWQSVIAHELGHYISFVILLKENNLDNITFETNLNSKQINDVINQFNEGRLSLNIVNEALNNFNNKYNTSYDIKDFAKTISNYAAEDLDNIVYDEIIAEAIHDYFLHNEDMEKSSKEIISIVKKRLGDL